MFAVIKTGGKQYSVQADDVIRVEKLDGEAGDMIQLSEVLMIGDQIGTPLVDGAVVTAEIVEHSRARKVIAFKKRRRQNSRRKIGHRQHYTEILISELLNKGEKPSKKSTGAGAAKSAGRSAAARGTVKQPSAEAGAAELPAKTEKAADKAAKEAKPAAKKEAAKTDAPKAAPDGPLFTAPKGEKDKLTDIKGIGPVAEKQLNEQGITTYKQIAELSADDIQRVDDYMPFSSAQIEDWQGQAKEKIA